MRLHKKNVLYFSNFQHGSKNSRFPRREYSFSEMTSSNACTQKQRKLKLTCRKKEHLETITTRNIDYRFSN